MPGSKSQLSKLPKDLQVSIKFGSGPSDGKQEIRDWVKERYGYVLREQLRKLQLLMPELDVPEQCWLSDARLDAARQAAVSSPAVGQMITGLVLLSIELGKRLYPGFCTELDDAKGRGRPRRQGVDDPAIVLKIVDSYLEHGIVSTTKDACRILVSVRDFGLMSPARHSELERRTKSLASVVATARASARRHAKAQVTNLQK
jgi:hypothetical protein